MKRSELKQLIKEEILKEMAVTEMAKLKSAGGELTDLGKMIKRIVSANKGKSVSDISKQVKKNDNVKKWLADNPDKGKDDYITKFPNRDPSNDANCHLCTVWVFAGKHCGEVGVFSSPKKDFKTMCPLDTKKLHCDDGTDSPWRNWSTRYYSNEARTKHAKRIVRACKRWLNKYVK